MASKVSRSSRLIICPLCITGKLWIIDFLNKKDLLNKKSELINKCRHYNKFIYLFISKCKEQVMFVWIFSLYYSAKCQLCFFSDK